jgi:TRAP-type C4-dicarboxylate transport system permease large subunit
MKRGYEPKMAAGVVAISETLRGAPAIEVFRGVWPHFIAHILALAILVMFPSIPLWLPSRMQ